MPCWLAARGTAFAYPRDTADSKGCATEVESSGLRRDFDEDSPCDNRRRPCYVYAVMAVDGERIKMDPDRRVMKCLLGSLGSCIE